MEGNYNQDMRKESIFNTRKEKEKEKENVANHGYVAATGQCNGPQGGWAECTAG